MKKVLALVLAVMMVSTMAFAATVSKSTISPSKKIEADEKGFILNGKNGIGVTEVTVGGTGTDPIEVLYQENPDTGELYNATTKNPAWQDSGDTSEDAEGTLPDVFDDDTEIDANAGKAGTRTSKYIRSLGDMIFRSITTDNYAVSSLKVVNGKAYVKGVEISNADERVQVKFVPDLNNTTAKDFDLSYTLKGKGKMIIRSVKEANKYNAFVRPTTLKNKGDTATIPSVKFKMSGKVGYGKVTVGIGTNNDEDLGSLEGAPTKTGYKNISLSDDVLKFSDARALADCIRTAQAGAFVADAILTEEYNEGALTMEARVYSGDVLYLNCDNDPHPVVDLLDTGDGDVDFFFFHEDKNFTTLNTNAKLVFNDTEEDDHVYSYNNGKLTEVGEYDDDEGCIVVRARRLGQYITSDIALDWLEIATSDDVENPDTGANDVVGIAAALAAVALVSAAAVTLKK